jgi:hypothetical protein
MTKRLADERRQRRQTANNFDLRHTAENATKNTSELMASTTRIKRNLLNSMAATTLIYNRNSDLKATKNHHILNLLEIVAVNHSQDARLPQLTNVMNQVLRDRRTQ